MPQLVIEQLESEQTEQLRSINKLFALAFEDHEHYCAKPPSDEYLQKMVNNPMFIPLAAFFGEKLVGAITAYELPKLEKQCSEIYIYDLAVAKEYRRRGIAIQMIRKLQQIGKERGVNVVYVQADLGDEPAIRLYEKLGVKAEVLHFDIT